MNKQRLYNIFIRAGIIRNLSSNKISTETLQKIGRDICDIHKDINLSYAGNVCHIGPVNGCFYTVVISLYKDAKRKKLKERILKELFSRIGFHHSKNGITYYCVSSNQYGRLNIFDEEYDHFLGNALIKTEHREAIVYPGVIRNQILSLISSKTLGYYEIKSMI